MKRLLALLCAMLFLTGCASSSERPTASLSAADPVALGESRSEPQIAQGILLVDEHLEQAFFDAAESFAQRLYEYSDGTVSLQVQRSTSAASIFTVGAAQLTFLDSRTNPNLTNYFPAVSKPFLYPNYNAFTMALNSQRVLDILSEDIESDISLLGAFSRPSHHLVSTWQSTNIAAFASATVAVDPAAGSAEGFRFLGSETVAVENASERARGLIDGEYDAAEMTLEEMLSVNWRGTDYYLTMTWHTSSPVWLASGNSFLSSLDRRQRAALDEALAWMFADIDGIYNIWERQFQNELAQQGLLLSEDFALAREEVFLNTYQGDIENANPQEQFIYGILRDIT